MIGPASSLEEDDARALDWNVSSPSKGPKQSPGPLFLLIRPYFLDFAGNLTSERITALRPPPLTGGSLFLYHKTKRKRERVVVLPPPARIKKKRVLYHLKRGKTTSFFLIKPTGWGIFHPNVSGPSSFCGIFVWLFFFGKKSPPPLRGVFFC